jgi:NADP+-dependent farnesol dehydrogenase
VAPGLVAGTGFAERYYEHSPDLREDLYDAHRNLSCDDVARAIVDLLAADEHVDVSEMVVRPVEQPT